MATQGAFSGSPVTPPPVTGPTFWVDASNYTGPLTPQGCADLKAAGYVGVIVQAITGNNGISYTRQQLTMARDNGLRLQGYVWCFPNTAKVSTTSRLSMFDGFELEYLWLDVEQAGLKQADVDRDLALCDQYFGGVTGIYSGRNVFLGNGWAGITKWSSRPLWNAYYDYVADVDEGFHPYAGWTSCLMKQYAGSSSVGRVIEVDRNIMRGN